MNIFEHNQRSIHVNNLTAARSRHKAEVSGDFLINGKSEVGNNDEFEVRITAHAVLQNEGRNKTEFTSAETFNFGGKGGGGKPRKD